jgi:hypothetical protein
MKKFVKANKRMKFKTTFFHAADECVYFCIILEHWLSPLRKALPSVIPHLLLIDYLFLKKTTAQHTLTQTGHGKWNQYAHSLLA